MWVCCHPLADHGQEDRMITRYATSVDGLHWRDRGVALRGTPGVSPSPSVPKVLNKHRPAATEPALRQHSSA